MAGYLNSDLVNLANEETSIYTVLSKLDVDYAQFYGTTAKLYCPFGSITHMDGGMTRAMRVYPDTNSAYCFGCSKYYNPVKLYAEFMDTDLAEAAELLLDEAGWKPETYESRWETVTQEKVFSTEDVQLALDEACQRKDPLWNVHATFDPYKSVYQECLAVLAYVTNAEQAAQWVEVSKRKMYEVLK